MQQTVGAQESRAIAEAARETEWRKPSFAKELFLGRLRLDLIHPHPRPDPARQRTGRGVPGPAAGIPRDRGRRRGDRTRGADTRRAHQGAQGSRGAGHAGARAVRRPGTEQAVLHQGVATGRLGQSRRWARCCRRTSRSVCRSRSSSSAREEQKQRYLPRLRHGRHQRLPAHRAGRRLATRPGCRHRGADRRTGRPTSSTASSCGRPTAWSPTCSSSWRRCPGRAGTAAASPPSSSRRTPRASPWRTATRSWACAASRTASPASTTSRARRRTSSDGGARASRSRSPRSTPGGSRSPRCAPAAASGARRSRASGPAARVQWGRPIGEHGAVAEKLAFIAATAFALDALQEMTAHAGRRGSQRHPHRGRDRQAVRLGDGASRSPTSSSRCAVGVAMRLPRRCAARGEKAVPVEQLLRDLRINRIFEGSTEIMHLLIAREAIDTHLAGRRRHHRPEVRTDEATSTGCCARRRLLRQLAAAAGGRCKASCPRRYTEFGRLASHLRYVERSSRRAGPLHVLRDVALAGSSWNIGKCSSDASSTSVRSSSP